MPRRKEPKVPMSFQLTRELREKIISYADERHISMAEVINLALEKFLDDL